MKKISVQKFQLELGFEGPDQVELGFGRHTIFDFPAKIVVLTTFPVSNQISGCFTEFYDQKYIYDQKNFVWVDQGPIL